MPNRGYRHYREHAHDSASARVRVCRGSAAPSLRRYPPLRNDLAI